MEYVKRIGAALNLIKSAQAANNGGFVEIEFDGKLDQPANGGFVEIEFDGKLDAPAPAGPKRLQKPEMLLNPGTAAHSPTAAIQATNKILGFSRESKPDANFMGKPGGPAGVDFAGANAREKELAHNEDVAFIARETGADWQTAENILKSRRMAIDSGADPAKLSRPIPQIRDSKKVAHEQLQAYYDEGGGFPASLQKGAATIELTVAAAVSMLADATGLDKDGAQALLDRTVEKYNSFPSDPRISAASGAASAGASEQGGVPQKMVAAVYEAAKSLGQSENAAGAIANFMAEQILPSLPGFGAGAKVGQAAMATRLGDVINRGTRKSLLKAGVVSAGSRAAKTKVDDAAAMASGNTAAVVGSALGPNYVEGLSKFPDDKEAAKSYALKKTMAEVPANAIAGMVMPLRLGKIGQSELALGLTQSMIQGVGGAAGAASANLAVGDPVNWGELAFEFLGKAASAVPEIAINEVMKGPKVKPATSGESPAAASPQPAQQPAPQPSPQSPVGIDPSATPESVFPTEEAAQQFVEQNGLDMLPVEVDGGFALKPIEVLDESGETVEESVEPDQTPQAEIKPGFTTPQPVNVDAVWQNADAQSTVFEQAAKILKDAGVVTSPEQLQPVVADIQKVRELGLDPTSYQSAIKGILRKYTKPSASVSAPPVQASATPVNIETNDQTPAQALTGTQSAQAATSIQATVPESRMGSTPVSAADGPVAESAAPVQSVAPVEIPISEAALSDKNLKAVLDLNKRPTGWLEFDHSNGTVLVNPVKKIALRFDSSNERSGTEALRAKARAQAHAIDNPIEIAASEPGELVVKPIFEKQDQNSEIKRNQPESADNFLSEPVSTVSDAPTTETVNPYKPLVEALIKRRAAAKEVGKSNLLDFSIKRAKQLMDGGDASAAKLKEAADKFDAAKDPTTADLLRQVAELRAEAGKAKRAAVPRPSRLTPIEQPIDEETAKDLRRLAAQAGWAEIGGRMIRKSEDYNSPDYDVITRSKWIPRADWYAELPPGSRLNENDTEAAVEKAITGRPMSTKEKRAVEALIEVSKSDRERFAAEPVNSSVDTPVAQAGEINEVDAEAAAEREAIQREDEVLDKVDDDLIAAFVDRTFDSPIQSRGKITDAELEAIFGPNPEQSPSAENAESNEPGSAAQSDIAAGDQARDAGNALELTGETEAEIATREAAKPDQAAEDRARLKLESEAGAKAFTLQPPEKPAAVAEAEFKAKQEDLLGEQKSAARSGDTQVPASKGVFEWLKVAVGKIFADYGALYNKHSDQFESQDEVRAQVERVINDADFAMPASKEEYTLLAKRGPDDQAVVVEFELRGGKYRVRSAYKFTAGQLDKKLEEAARRWGGTPKFLVRGELPPSVSKLLPASRDTVQPSKSSIAQTPEGQSGKPLMEDSAQPFTGVVSEESAKEAAKTTPAKIDDAGEKIGGARKDRWKERGLRVTDLDDMSNTEGAELATKDNVWPKPNYADLIASGVEPKAAAFIKIMRDRIAAKANQDTPEGRRQYVETLSIVADKAKEIRTVEDAAGLSKAVQNALGITERSSIYSSEGRALLQRLYAIYKGRKNPLYLGYAEGKKAADMLNEGWPAKREGAKRTDGGKAEPKRPHLDTIERLGEDVRAGRNITPEDFIAEFGFRGIEFGNWAAQDERQRLINLAFEALHDLAGVLGIPPKAVSLNGTLGLALGARGGGKFAAHYEPGKLVINMTKINGAGALAHEWGHALDHYFGEVDKPNAYQGKPSGASGWYKKGKVDLTHLRSEMKDSFEQVLDALFNRDKSKAEAVREVELDIEKLSGNIASADRALESGKLNNHDIKRWKQYRDQLKTRLTMRQARLLKLTGEEKPEGGYGKVESSYYQNAQKLSGKSENGYWTRPTEMFARAFEAYVFDKIKSDDRVSQYLVQGVEENRYADPKYRGDPYPEGEERKKIDQAFDKLFETMESKETDKGVALYTTRSRSSFERFAALGKNVGTPSQALADAEEITGLKFGVPVREADLGQHVPARFLLSERVIEVNKNWAYGRAEGAQYIAEELLHAVDSLSDVRTLSASSKRLAIGKGDIALEAQKHFEADDTYSNFLKYPIADDTLSDTIEQAELFARLGVLYFGEPELMRQSLPLAYEAFDGIFQLRIHPVTDEISRKVWSFTGRSIRNIPLGGQYGPDRSPSGRDEGGTRNGSRSELGRLREFIRRHFQTNPLGAKVDFGRSDSRSLKTRPDAGFFDPGPFESLSKTLRQTRGSDQAKRAARSFLGQPITNEETGITATVSGMSLMKMLSKSAVDRSVSPQAHMMAVGNLDTLFRLAAARETRSPKKDVDNVALIHHFEVPMPFDADVLRVKIMAKEFAEKGRGTRLYLVQAVEIENAGVVGKDHMSGQFQREASSASSPPPDVSSRFAQMADAVKRGMGGRDLLDDELPIDLPKETRGQKAQRYVQDKFNRVKIAERAVTAAGGRITERSSPYLAEELMHGKAETRLENVRETLFKPLEDAITAARKAHKLSLGDIQDYLIAKHAKERNAYIRSIDKDNDAGSGMTDARADEIVDAARDAGTLDALEAISEKAQAISEFNLDTMANDGLEPAEYVESLRGWKNYVPLKTVDMDGMPGPGRGFSIGGRESKRALGRHSEAGQVLENLMLQTERLIIRSEKNKVANAFLNMVLQNPREGLWEVAKVKHKRVLNDGEVRFVPNHTAAFADNVIQAKRNGQTYLITVHDPLIARAMKNLSQEDRHEAIDKVFYALGAINRYFALINTSLNPEFVITNLARDIQTAFINLSAEQSMKMAGAMVKDIGPAIRGAFRVIRKRPGPKTEYQQWYEEYAAQGGKVGFFGLEPVGVRQRQLERLIKRTDGDLWWNTVEGYKAVAKYIMDMNATIENATRLAAYANARKRGFSKAQAASLAKNLTVNFNRKGELGTVINSLYLFANASIQGTTRLVQMLKTKRGKAIFAGIAIGAFALDAFNRAISEASDGEDEDPYKRLTDFEKQRNLIIMRLDGTYYKIPLPYGYNVPYVIGAQIGGLLDGDKPLDASLKVLHAMVESFNPLGGSDIYQTLAPTLADPFVQIERNTSFSGSMLRPEQNKFEPVPDSQLAFKSASPTAKWIAETLNEKTGGNEVRPGGIDVSPSSIEVVASTIVGGAGRFATNLYRYPAGTSDRVPIAHRFYGKPPEWYEQKLYYKNMQEVDTVARELKLLVEKGEDPSEFIENNLDKLQLEQAGDQYNKAISQLNKQIRMTKDEAEVKELEAMKKSLMKDFNKAVGAQAD